MFTITTTPAPTVVLDPWERGILARCPSYTQTITPARLLEHLANVPIYGTDTETTGLSRTKDHVLFWSLSDGDNRWSLTRSQLPLFKAFLEDASKQQVYANANFDAAMFYNSGVDVLANGRKQFHRWDVIVMHALLVDNQDHGLKDVARSVLNLRMRPFKDVFAACGAKSENEMGAQLLRYYETDPYRVIDYQSLDSWATFRAREELAVKLAAAVSSTGMDLLTYYEGIEMPMHEVLLSMEREGVHVDKIKLRAMRSRLEQELETTFLELTAVLGKVINPKSSAQLRDLFFTKNERGEWVDNEGNAPTKLTKGGKTGNKLPSTDGEVLKALAAGNDPRAKALAKFKKRVTAIQYLEQYEEKEHNGRIHTTLNQARAATGRLCVAGSTELATPLGTFRIDELDLRSKHRNVTIQTHVGRQRKILNLFYKGKEEMFRVTASDGSTITGTAGHGLLAARGWAKIDELREGSHVWTASQPLYGAEDPRRGGCRLSDHSEPHRVRVPVSGEGVHGSEGARAVSRDKQEPPRAQQKDVREGVRDGTQAATEQAPRPSGHGKSARRTEVGVVPAGRDGAAGSDRSRSPSAGHRAQTGRLQEGGAGEYAALRPQPDADYPTPIAPCGQSTHGSAGVLRAGHRGASQELLSRPGGVLHRALRGALRHTEAVVVREGTGALAREREGTRSCAEELGLVELQQVRAEALYGPDGSQHTARQGSDSRRKHEGRLCVPWDRPAGGDRRGVPHEQRDDEGAGREEGGSGSSSGAGDLPCHDQGRGQRPWFGGGGHRRLCEVISIESVGVQDVWDIEVEEDHSYVAQGLIHHNSSSDPNLQNVSKDNDDFAIRSLFLPKPGYLLGDADQAQLEMRIVASQSRDQALINAIRAGRDLHAWTAHRMFDIPYDATMAAIALKEAKLPMSPEQAELVKLRGHTKQINFGVIYGETAFKLSKQIGCSLERAEELLELYWLSYGDLRKFFVWVREFVNDNGYIETPLGRRRWIHQSRVRGLSDRDYERGMRQAGNHPIQGMASELIKCAQIRIYCDEDMWSAGHRQILQVHDEIVTQGPPELYADPAFVARFEHYMAYPFGDDKAPLVVPLAAKLHVGANWSEAK